MFNTCSKCPAKWTGENRSHCAACHITFGGVASFDRHRQIGRASGKRCLTPQEIDLTDNGNGVWVAKYGGADGD